MFTWLKNLFFGAEESNPTLKTYTPPVVEEPKVAKKPSAAKNKKESTPDLGKMTKPQLIEYAKKKGIKVNASLKKADILKSING